MYVLKGNYEVKTPKKVGPVLLSDVNTAGWPWAGRPLNKVLSFFCKKWINLLLRLHPAEVTWQPVGYVLGHEVKPLLYWETIHLVLSIHSLNPDYVWRSLHHQPVKVMRFICCRGYERELLTELVSKRPQLSSAGVDSPTPTNNTSAFSISSNA